MFFNDEGPNTKSDEERELYARRMLMMLQMPVLNLVVEEEESEMRKTKKCCTCRSKQHGIDSS